MLHPEFTPGARVASKDYLEMVIIFRRPTSDEDVTCSWLVPNPARGPGVMDTHAASFKIEELTLLSPAPTFQVQEEAPLP